MSITKIIQILKDYYGDVTNLTSSDDTQYAINAFKKIMLSPFENVAKYLYESLLSNNDCPVIEAMIKEISNDATLMYMFIIYNPSAIIFEKVAAFIFRSIYHLF